MQGEGDTGYDAVYALKQWLREQGEPDESVCSLLLKRGGSWAKHVGRANVYYAHRRSRPLARTLACMRRFCKLHAAELPTSYGEQVYFWIDYASVELCRSREAWEPSSVEPCSSGAEWEPSKTVATVRSLPMTVLEFDGDPRKFFSRSVCLLEAYAAIGDVEASSEGAAAADAGVRDRHTPRGGASSGRLRVCMDPLRAAQCAAYDSPVLADARIDVRTAQAADESRREKVCAYVMANVDGGYDALNGLVKRAVAAEAFREAQRCAALAHAHTTPQAHACTQTHPPVPASTGTRKRRRSTSPTALSRRKSASPLLRRSPLHPPSARGTMAPRAFDVALTRLRPVDRPVDRPPRPPPLPHIHPFTRGAGSALRR